MIIEQRSFKVILSQSFSCNPINVFFLNHNVILIKVAFEILMKNNIEVTYIDII